MKIKAIYHWIMLKWYCFLTSSDIDRLERREFVVDDYEARKHLAKRKGVIALGTQKKVKKKLTKKLVKK